MVTTHTLDNAERTLFYEMVEVVGIRGAKPVVPVLWPFSRLVIDGAEYIEMNALSGGGSSLREDGGSHAVPSYGKVVKIEYADRRQGFDGGGDTIHRAGWV